MTVPIERKVHIVAYVKYPDGYVMQVYVRSGVSLIINIDRYEGGENDFERGQLDDAFGMLFLERCYKHYRRFLELPASRLIHAAVAAGEMEAPAITAYIRCIPSLDDVRSFLRSEALPRAFKWDIENDLITEADVLLDDLATALAREIQEGNREEQMELLSFQELMRRMAEGN